MAIGDPDMGREEEGSTAQAFIMARENFKRAGLAYARRKGSLHELGQAALVFEKAYTAWKRDKR
jgi:hypothetical protein